MYTRVDRPLFRSWLRVVLLLLAGGIAASSQAATTWYVKKTAAGPTHDGSTWTQAFQTVQAGINAAASGDQVWVAADTYGEQITLKSGVKLYGGFAGTETTFAQRNITTNVTVLNGTRAGVEVTVPAGASSVTTIDGFTVQNGTSGISGAGSLVISGNTIINNKNSGILLSSGSPTIAGNTVDSNADNGIRADGTPLAISNNIVTNSGLGGIYCNLDPAANVSILGNAVNFNTVGNGNGGGGISVFNGTAAIKNNKLKGNSANQGGGIFATAGTVTISDNLLVTNNAVTSGGGIYTSGSSGVIANNTIVGNTAGSAGGAIYTDAGTVTFANNIVAYNGSGIAHVTGTLTLVKNDLYRNLNYNYGGVSAGATDITSDPQLASPVTRDLHIQPTSPCKDTGSNTYVTAGDTDMDGQVRIKNTTVDIGADESDGTVYTIATPIIRVKPSSDATNPGDDANDGSDWTKAKATVQAAINAAAGGGEVWVKYGVYTEQLTMATGVTLLGGFVGIETDNTQRKPAQYTTVLDGGTAPITLNVPSGAGSPETVDGFTITHGGATGTGPGGNTGTGVAANAAGIAITNDVLASNQDAVNVNGSSLTLTGSTIRNNARYGVYSSASIVTAQSNTIKSNGSYGIRATSSSVVTATGNTIQANGDHGIYGDSGVINASTNTVVSNNTGIYWVGTSSLTNNTLQTNGQYGAYLQGTGTATGNQILSNGSTGLYITGQGAAANNTVTGNGNGGIQVVSTVAVSPGYSVSVTGNTVTGNNAYAGVLCYLTAPATGTVTGNTITGNTANSSNYDSGWGSNGNGGGIYLNGGAANVQNNTVSGNSACNGAGIFAQNSAAIIANNVVLTNGASYYGGGIFLRGGTPSVINDTFSGNTAAAAAGGVYAFQTTATLANTIVAFNNSGVYREASSTLTVSHNDVFGNTDYDSFSVNLGANGNISKDPIFASGPSRNVHIQATSPAVNAGDNAQAQAAWKDIDGQARIQNTTVDIGADESDGTTYTITRPIVRVNPQSGDDAKDGSTWANAKKTLQAAINAAAGGGEVWASNTAHYNELLTLKSGVEVYGGFLGNEASRAQRNFTANLTVIDAQNTGVVVTVPPGTGSDVVLDGFTLGNFTVGTNFHGVVVNNSSLVLANDVISLNKDGIFSAGSELTLTNTTVQTNAATGVECRANSSVHITGGLVTANGGHGVYGDSGTLSIVNATSQSNNSDGIQWTGVSTLTGITSQNNGSNGANLGGTSTITTSTFSGNGSRGVNASGTLVITGNMALGNHDGGIVTSSNVPVLTGSTLTITGNTVSNNSSGSVAGIYCGLTLPATALIQGNTITGNSNGNTDVNNSGGGLEVIGGVPVALNNTLYNNRSVYGGGIFTRQSDAILANNAISGNVASNSGGGIYVNQGNPKIINDTIASNGGGASGDGGGIYLTNTTATIANTIVAFNTANGIFKSANSTPVLNHNDVFGNTQSDFSGFAASPTGSGGNISIDPQLASPLANNLHIQPASPARNAGDNTVVDSTWTDIDGQPRIQNTTVDIGADESDGTVWTVPTFTIYVNGATGNDNNNGQTWALAKRTVQSGINAAQGGGQVWVAQGIYSEVLTLRGGVKLYGGFAGSETVVTQANPVTNLTVINAQQNGDVITVPPAAGATQVIDGFTLGNTTTTTNHDGVVVNSAAVIINRCTITLTRYGINAAGSTLQVTNSSVSNNANTGIICGGNSSLSLNLDTVNSNNSHGISGDSGTLLVMGSTLNGNNGHGITWTGTTTITGNNIKNNNGRGINTSGSYTLGNNVVANNADDGIYVTSGLGTVSGNTVNGNRNTGILVTATDPVLTGYSVSILNNTVQNNTGSSQIGGIYLALNGSSSGLIQYNTITGNNNTRGDAGNPGGGLYVYNGAPVVLNNVITGNSAYNGGGVYIDRSNAVFADNIVASNGAPTVAGGILVNQGSPLVVNNTIVGNSAAGDGGAIVLDGTSGHFANNLIAYNTSGLFETTRVPTTAPLINHNDLWQNTRYDVSGLPIDGNISVDPKLVGPPVRDLHIEGNSPLKDAGDDSVIQAGWKDLDGQARIQGAHVDIGADESDGTLTTITPIIIRVKPASDATNPGSDANDGSAWNKAKATIQGGIAAAAGGGEVWVEGATYNEQVVLAPAVAIYGGFIGTESLRADRNPAINTTIINGQYSGNVVTVNSGTGATETIDGFIIEKSATGGDVGLYIINSAVNVANCTLSQNDYGLYVYGSLVNVSNSTSIGNNRQGIYNTRNSLLTLTNVSVTSNATTGIQADNGTLNATNLTCTGNNGHGINWPDTVTINGGNISSNNGHGVVFPYVLNMNGVTVSNNNGYGIYTNAGFITVSGCNVKGNKDTGLYIQGNSPVLTGYTVNVNGNLVQGNTSGKVAGIYVGLSGSATGLVKGNRILGNVNQNNTNGAGLYLDGGVTTALDNLIQSNTTGNGAGVFLNNSNSVLASNVIVNNTVTANGKGGGVYINGGQPSLYNNTIADNTAPASGDAGGVYVAGSTVTLENNIIADNNQGGIAQNNTSTLTLDYNDVFGNTVYAYKGLPDPLNHNVKIAPGFRNEASQDYHLLTNSPLIDQGDDSVIQPSWLDADGQPRIRGAHVDMGAYETGGPIATKLAFNPQPVGGAAGQLLATQPSVVAVDSGGHTDATFNGPVTVAFKAGTNTTGAVLSGTLTVNALFGVATFTDLAVDKAGTGYVLTATATGLTSVDSAPFTVGASLFTLADATRALQIAGGLAAANSADVTRLNVEKGTGTATTITIADAVRLVRKVAGKDANP